MRNFLKITEVKVIKNLPYDPILATTN